MITKTNLLIDDSHNLTIVNRVDVKYSSLLLIFVRHDMETNVTITWNGYPITINKKGEFSRYLPLHSKEDFERLLRNYIKLSSSQYIFDDEKFFKKFHKNIVATF